MRNDEQNGLQTKSARRKRTVSPTISPLEIRPSQHYRFRLLSMAYLIDGSANDTTGR